MNNLGVTESPLGSDSSVAADPSIGTRTQADKSSTIDSRSSSKEFDPSHLNHTNGSDPGSSAMTSSGSSGVGPASVASPRSSSTSTSSSTSVRPSDGVLHHLKKAFSLTHSHVGEDPLINEAYEKLEASKSDLTRLRSSLNEYENLSRQFASAFNQVCQDSVRCFQDYQHPYAELAKQMMAIQQQQQLILESNSISPLIDQVDQLCSAAAEDQKQIQKQLDERNTKLSDVQYYSSKVEKLKQEETTSEGEAEKLDRNITKYDKIQEEYNRENEQLVRGMNETWKKRCLSLGLILVQFLQKRGEFENQQQFTQFQPQLNSLSDQAKQEKLKQLELKSANLVPNDAGKIREEPSDQRADESQTLASQQQTDLSNPRSSDVSLHQPNTNAHRSPPPTAADSSSKSSRGATSAGPPPLVDLVLWEEQVGYHKETFVRERVHVRKSVTTDTVTMTIPIRKENLEIESETLEPDIASSLSSLSFSQNEVGGEGRGMKNKEERGAEVPVGEIGGSTGRGRDMASERDGNGERLKSIGAERSSRVTSGDGNRGSSSWDQMKEGDAREGSSRFPEDSSKDISSFPSTRDVKGDVHQGKQEGDELVLILYEERPRFILDWVPVERVVVKKSREQSIQMLETEVRKETVHLDESGVHSLPKGPLIV